MENYCEQVHTLGNEICQLYGNAQYYHSIGELEGAIVSYSSAASMIHVLLTTGVLTNPSSKSTRQHEQLQDTPSISRQPSADIKHIKKDDSLDQGDAIDDKIPQATRSNSSIVRRQFNATTSQIDELQCSRGLPCSIDVHITGEVTTLTQGLNKMLVNCLGQIEGLQKRIRERNIKNNEEDDEDAITCQNVKNIAFEGSDCITFNDIIGLFNEKKILRTSFLNPLTYPNIYPKLGSGILFYGFPGTGKTFIAKAAVNQLQIENKNVSVLFFTPTGAELKGKFVGETEKNIKKMFACASQRADECEANQNQDADTKKKYISIVFIDEFDSIAGSRDDDPSGLKANAVNTLLQMMDGISSYNNVSVIAVTNYPWKLDTAILRRFDRQILFNLSDSNSIFEQMKLEYAKNIKIRNVKSKTKKENKDKDQNTCEPKCGEKGSNPKNKIDDGLFTLDLFDKTNTQRMKNICDFYEHSHYSSSDISKVINQAITNSGNDSISNGLFYKLPTNKLPESSFNKEHNSLVEPVNKFFDNTKITSGGKDDKFNDIYMSTLTNLKGTTGKIYMAKLMKSYYTNLQQKFNGMEIEGEIHNDSIVNISNQNVNGIIHYNGKKYYNTKILPFICTDIPVNIKNITNVYVETDIDNLIDNFMNYDDIKVAMASNSLNKINIPLSTGYYSKSETLEMGDIVLNVEFNVNPKTKHVEITIKRTQNIDVSSIDSVNFIDGGATDVMVTANSIAHNITFTVEQVKNNNISISYVVDGDKNKIKISSLDGKQIKPDPICMYTYDEWITHNPSRKINMILESDELSLKYNNKFEGNNIPIFNSIYEKIYELSIKGKDETIIDTSLKLYEQLKNAIGSILKYEDSNTFSISAAINTSTDFINFNETLCVSNNYGNDTMVLLDEEFAEKLPFRGISIYYPNKSNKKLYRGDTVKVIHMTNKLQKGRWFNDSFQRNIIEGFYMNNVNGKLSYYAKLSINSYAWGIPYKYVNVHNLDIVTPGSDAANIEQNCSSNRKIERDDKNVIIAIGKKRQEDGCLIIKDVVRSKHLENIKKEGGRIKIEELNDEATHSILVKTCAYIQFIKDLYEKYMGKINTNKLSNDNEYAVELLFAIYILYGYICNEDGTRLVNVDDYDISKCTISVIWDKYFILRDKIDFASIRKILTNEFIHVESQSFSKDVDKIRLFIMDDYFVSKAACIGNSFSNNHGLKYDNKKKSRKMYFHLKEYNIYDPNIRNKLAASVFGFKRNWGYIGQKDIIDEKETFLSQVSNYKLDPLEYLLQGSNYVGISTNDSIKWFNKSNNAVFSNISFLTASIGFPLETVMFICALIKNNINIISNIYNEPKEAIERIIGLITASGFVYVLRVYSMGEISSIIQGIIGILVEYIGLSSLSTLGIAFGAAMGLHFITHTILYLLQINKHNPMDMRLYKILDDGIIDIPLSMNVDNILSEDIVQAINYNNDSAFATIVSSVKNFMINITTSSYIDKRSIIRTNMLSTESINTSTIIAYNNNKYKGDDINKNLKHINVSLKNLTDVDFHSSYDKKLGNELKMYNDNREKFLEQYHKQK